MLSALKKNLQLSDAERASWHIHAMEQLIGVVQQLSQARDVEAVTAIVREAARNLTGADGATFVLRDGDQCYYAEENAIAPLWKGRRFPMSICISGWVMLNGRPAVIEDIYNDSRIPIEAYRPTFVKSLVMVPIRRNAPIGAIGNYWASKRMPSEEEISILQALADTTSVALENADLYGRLQGQVQTLQEQHQSLETFAHALSHDLKEPAHILASFIPLLAPGAGDTQAKYLGYVRNASKRLAMLIESVFYYTQLGNTDRALAPCAMEEVANSVEDMLAPLIRESGATIRHTNLPTIPANKAHMTELFKQLLTNAIIHNDKKITVEIAATERAEDWLFTVSDDGRGIDPAHAKQVFLPFKRLTPKEGCAGLGLAICKKIIEMHGGSLWCKSVTGATFFFTLPKPASAQ